MALLPFYFEKKEMLNFRNYQDKKDGAAPIIPQRGMPSRRGMERLLKPQRRKDFLGTRRHRDTEIF